MRDACHHHFADRHCISQLPNGTIEVDDDKDDDILNRGFVPVPASRRRPRKKEVTEQATVPLHQQNGDDMRLDMVRAFVL